ncbi:hypothetical protein [Pontibacter burrus]|uniref:Uncharacterized protein n=1 Tax=Pontibacter burrus TaxID=2704466 RepID=A0A6B3LHW3_9BACT|nr:hypothetical protein [Pontibacter burrus]NEM96179.1 hypothetical protein [Pontibacter burrus]
MAKTEVYTADQWKAMNPAKKPGPIKAKPEKKVTSASQEMDLGQTPEQQALSAITINRRAQLVHYCESEGYIEFDMGGRTWCVKVEEVKP